MVRLTSLPPYGIGALIIILLWAAQAEIRFGSRARTARAGASDRNSTPALTIAAFVPILGFALGIRSNSPGLVSSLLPGWFRMAQVPGMPAAAWLGVFLGVCGLSLRLWAVMTLRERYTRTLLIQDRQAVESKGPYRWVRHPGYLGSLLSLNGVVLASGNWIALLASLAATGWAYGYRIKVEERMLLAGLGPAYSEYREQVGALFPKLRARS
jgi:protein-S-isoprenylcysteine O-methyltransferase Ste14